MCSFAVGIHTTEFKPRTRGIAMYTTLPHMGKKDRWGYFHIHCFSLYFALTDNTVFTFLLTLVCCTWNGWDTLLAARLTWVTSQLLPWLPDRDHSGFPRVFAVFSWNETVNTWIFWCTGDFPVHLRQIKEDAPFLGFMCLAFTRMLCDSCCRRFRSLLLCPLLYI